MEAGIAVFMVGVPLLLILYAVHKLAEPHCKHFIGLFLSLADSYRTN
jgi:hypothetical protein